MWKRGWAHGGETPFFTACSKHLAQEQAGPASSPFLAVKPNLLKRLCDSTRKTSAHEEEVINTSNYKYIPLKIDIDKQLQTVLGLADLAEEKKVDECPESNTFDC